MYLPQVFYLKSRSKRNNKLSAACFSQTKKACVPCRRHRRRFQNQIHQHHVACLFSCRRRFISLTNTPKSCTNAYIICRRRRFQTKKRLIMFSAATFSPKTNTPTTYKNVYIICHRHLFQKQIHAQRHMFVAVDVLFKQVHQNLCKHAMFSAAGTSFKQTNKKHHHVKDIYCLAPAPFSKRT